MLASRRPPGATVTSPEAKIIEAGNLDHRDHRDFLRQSRVVVVVPIYKNEIDDDEKLSLAACRRCLSQYEIVFMAPERMRDRLPAYVDEGTVDLFPDHYFENIRTYSRLLTRDEFWERFFAYQIGRAHV